VSYYSSWSAYFKLWLFCPLINFLFGNINLFLYVIIMSFLIFYLLVCISRLFIILSFCYYFFFSSRRRHTRFSRDWSSDVCSSDLPRPDPHAVDPPGRDDGGAVATAAVPQGCQSSLSRSAVGAPRRPGLGHDAPGRSEERRVGKECRSGRSARG